MKTKKPKKPLSPWAAVAKECRNYFKGHGIKAKVTSSSYSMGDNVNVKVHDLRPEVAKEAEKFCNKYQYGHFDGMTDCYEYSNKREDIPQTKFMFFANRRSEAMNDCINVWLVKNWGNDEDLKPQGYRLQELMYDCFSSSIEGFWRDYDKFIAARGRDE